MSKDPSVITPSDAAHIADTVYAVRTGASVSDVFSSLILQNFEISDRSKFDGSISECSNWFWYCGTREGGF